MAGCGSLPHVAREVDRTGAARRSSVVPVSRRTILALVFGACAVVAALAQLGSLAPFVLVGILLVGNAAVAAISMRRRSVRGGVAGTESFIAPMTAAWLVVCLLPIHNFAYRPTTEAATSLAREPIIELFVFTLVGVLAATVIRSLEPTLAVARPPVVLYLLPVWIIGGATWSQWGPYSFARGLEMVAVATLAWATIAIGRSDADVLRRLVGAYCRWFVRVVGALVVLGVVFGNAYVPTNAKNLERFSWVGAHPNAAGLVLSAAIVLVAAAPPRVLRLPPPVVGVVGVVFVAAMYQNHSRTAWACLAVGLVLVLVLRGAITPLVRTVGMPLVACGAVLAFRFGGSGIWDYILRDNDSSALSTGNGRLELWPIGLRNLEGPLDWIGGLGFGATRVIFIREVAWATSAHNSFLAILVSCGIVGLVFFVGLIGRLVLDVVRTRLWMNTELGVVMVSLLGVVLLNGLTTDTLAEPTLGYCALHLIAAYAIVQRERRSASPDPLASTVGDRAEVVLTNDDREHR